VNEFNEYNQLHNPSQDTKQILALRAASNRVRGGSETFLHLRSNQLRAQHIAAIMERANERNANRRYEDD
jgi:hypothetical protein